MTHKFTTGVRFNHNLGTLETLSFLGEGVGAALYIASVLTGQLLLSVLGIVFVVGAVVALLAHLGNPQRSFRTPRRVATAWVSRGTVVISGFVGLAALSVAGNWIGFLEPFQNMLVIAALVFSVPVIVYAGMLLRSMRAIRLWNGPFVPLAFISHSLATGLTIALGLVTLMALDAQSSWLAPAALIFLLLCAAISALHLSRVQPSDGTRASLHRLFGGDLRRNFIWGAWVVGIALPAAIIVLAVLGFANGGLVALAALLRLYGDFAYRNAIVVAGAYEPLFPSRAGAAYTARSSAA